MIKEEFLHFIWKYRLFDPEYFYYRDAKIEVIDTGQHNLSSGPDFFNARIRIGNTLWAGNVEIHVKASDWFKHKHENDPAYDNIILHLVYDPDQAVYRDNGEEIPFTRLAFHPRLLKQYENLLQERENKSCYPFFAKMDKVFYRDWIGKLGFSRLERRVEDLTQLLESNQYDWNETLYISIASAMGAKQNAEPFKMLARSVPLKFLYKYRDNFRVLNAAYFGQGGFLDETITDDYYYSNLQKEYKSIKQYLHEPLPGKYIWKLMRLRPAAFPTVRIPQFISLVKNVFPLMERLTGMKNIEEIIQLFSDSVKNYWTEHFLYGKPGRRSEYMPSTETYRLWILNAVIPLLFAYGAVRNKEEFKKLAIDLFEELPPENNEILKKWNKFGIYAENAFDSQALIELKSRYCDHGRCTECMVGQKFLTNARSKR
ncbi:MAG: DUF2851 family protein [Bacteroidales bacterium]